jgi:hypothetical protein
MDTGHNYISNHGLVYFFLNISSVAEFLQLVYHNCIGRWSRMDPSRHSWLLG